MDNCVCITMYVIYFDLWKTVEIIIKHDKDNSLYTFMENTIYITVLGPGIITYSL